MNYALIVGKLVKLPNIKKINDNNVVELVVATTYDKITEFHTVKIWRKNTSYFKKFSVNDTIVCEGKITTDKYEKNGEIVYRKYILSNKVHRI